MSRTPVGNAGFGRATDGATAVEFALVAGPFILLLLFTIEVGFMLLTAFALQHGVQEAGRLVRTGQAQADQDSGTEGIQPMTAEAFKQSICSKAIVLIDCPSQIGIYVENEANFTLLNQNTPETSQITPGMSVFDPGEGRRAVVIIATYQKGFMLDWGFGLPFMKKSNIGRIRELHGVSVFRNEAF